MKQELKPLSWLVKNFDINTQEIKNYDVLWYKEDFIKKLKKKCATKEEFAEKLRAKIACHYWSRAEYELVIKQTDDGHIWLYPWCGCREPDKVKIDVTNDESFDWKNFAVEHINKQIFKNEAKIDIYDQLTYKDQFEKLIDYCWYTRLRYERDNPKFHK